MFRALKFTPRCRRALTLLAIGTLPALTSTQAQSSPWSDLARRDLQFLYETIQTHHPGPADSLNPGFKVWLHEGYAKALLLADSARTLDGVLAAITYYVAGFRDGHLTFAPTHSRSSLSWPGILVSHRSGRTIVAHVAEWVDQRPPLGAEVLSCGGRTPADILAQDVLPNTEGIPALESTQIRLTPAILTWNGNPRRTRPSGCTVRDSAGTREVALRWRGAPRAEIEGLMARHAFGVAPTRFELTQPSPGVLWLTVPSFAENQGDNKAGLEALIRGLREARDPKLVVFDVRGNRGGNSAWGNQLLSALLGEAYVNDVIASMSRGAYSQWRTSKENADFVQTNSVARTTPGSSAFQQWSRIVTVINESRTAGMQITPPTQVNMSESNGERPEHPLGRRVILLTDGWCARACLDFADIVRAVRGSRHVGGQTDADAVYIDNRFATVPSGLGSFNFAMKVWRNRPRGHNEAYTPSLAYRGENWDTPSLQRWLIDLVKP